MNKCKICNTPIPKGIAKTCKSIDCKKQNQELHNIKYREKQKEIRAKWIPHTIDIKQPKNDTCYPVCEIESSSNIAFKHALYRLGLTIRKPYTKKRRDKVTATYEFAVWCNEFTLYQLVTDRYEKYKKTFNYKYLESTKNFNRIYEKVRALNGA